jgi:hypothetical protein
LNGIWLTFFGEIVPATVKTTRQQLRASYLKVSNEGTKMNAESKNLGCWSKWILFAAFLITIPVPFFMIVVGGMIPTICIIYLAVFGLVVALPKFTIEAFWMLGILWTHVIIIAGMLYIVAASINWLLFRLLPSRAALYSVFVVIVALFVASGFEIYRLPGHNSAPPANLLQVITNFAHWING